MPIQRIVGLVLFVAGAVLLYEGWRARQSVGAHIMETLQGTPSDRVLWMLGVGVVLAVVGIVIATRS